MARLTTATYASPASARHSLERDGRRDQHEHDRTRIASLSLDLSCAIRNIQARQSCDIVWIHDQVIDRIAKIPEECANMVVLLIVLLLLFGGGGFYLGGPAVGGSLGGLILLVLVVMLVTGRTGSRA
jgi:hypothetical protein